MSEIAIKFQSGARGRLEAQSFYAWLSRAGVEIYQKSRAGCERGEVAFIFAPDQLEISCLEAPGREAPGFAPRASGSLAGALDVGA